MRKILLEDMHFSPPNQYALQDIFKGILYGYIDV